jgi:hypothetical protein
MTASDISGGGQPSGAQGVGVGGSGVAVGVGVGVGVGVQDAGGQGVFVGGTGIVGQGLHTGCQLGKDPPYVRFVTCTTLLPFGLIVKICPDPSLAWPWNATRVPLGDQCGSHSLGVSAGSMS